MRPSPHRSAPAYAGLGVLLAALAGCAARPAEPSRQEPAQPSLARKDIEWLARVNFGIDTASVRSYQELGREGYLDAQLALHDAALPAPISAEIEAMEISRLDPVQEIAAVNSERQRISTIGDDPGKQQAKKDLNERGNRLAYEAARRDLLRAVYSPAQLQEQIIWFWLNHFSVFERKAELRWLIGDYEEQAIRPHALGHFKDLVLATLEHPAMLQYLDNRQNKAGRSNENYARELLELHTLGVNGGYSQQDVQQLAHILTGVGINTAKSPLLRRDWQGLYRRQGAFEFNPAQHDFGDKLLLGKTIHGTGFDEVQAAVALIVRQKACAQFISEKIARYFVADNPPPALVERMARTFAQSDGDIAAVLRTMFLSREFDQAGGSKFKDPQRFVVSAVRFAYDGRPISNTRPLYRWMNELGEAPYGHQTPDGYALTEAGWASSGQMSRRFEIARAIGAGNAGLFDPEDGAMGGTSGFPQLSNRLYYGTIEPLLSAQTRATLGEANSQQEWNMLLLSSPEFNYE